MIFLDAKPFIAEAIESVLAQDFTDFELILVDDGSTDGSTTIARDYAFRYDRTVRYLAHDRHENRGMSPSRNVGVGAARGDFIAFLDADDEWDSKKLMEQVAIMDALPEVGLVCGAPRYWASWNGGVDRIIPTGHVANVVIPPPEAALALYPLGKASAPCPSDILIRRDLLRALGACEEHFIGVPQLYEDQGFLLKAYLAMPVYFSDRVWLNYRQHPTSYLTTMSRDRTRYHQARLYFLNWLEQYVAGLPGADQRVHAAIQRNLWPYRHPILNRTAERLFAILQRGQRTAARLRS